MLIIVPFRFGGPRSLRGTVYTRCRHTAPPLSVSKGRHGAALGG
jgi:hypothetical protein